MNQKGRPRAVCWLVGKFLLYANTSGVNPRGHQSANSMWGPPRLPAISGIVKQACYDSKELVDSAPVLNKNRVLDSIPNQETNYVIKLTNWKKISRWMDLDGKKYIDHYHAN